MADPRLNREMFMHTATGQGSNELSFEESRVNDYLRAYTTTGRPPPPCPPQPADEQLRRSMGLPPLFKPTAVPQTNAGEAAIQPPAIQPTPSTSSAPHEPPAMHWFRPMAESGVVYHNITVQPEFSRFCMEELRCQAYRAGLKVPSLPMPPIPAPAPLPQPLQRTDTMAMSLMDVPQQQQQSATKPYAYDGDGKLLSITTSPQYNQHSFEELRVAYMMYGRESTSAEILAHTNPTPNPSHFGHTLGARPPQPQNAGMLVSGPSMARLY